MIVSIIVAVAENGVIGKDNTLIWHLPADMHYFKEKTIGHHVISGRKNYESIPEKYRPLIERTNLVLTRNKNYEAPGAVVVHSLEEAIAYAKNKNETECFIIGGAEIYREALAKRMVDRLYITEIEKSFEGDAFFALPDEVHWEKKSENAHPADEKNKHAFSFCVYEKRK